MKLPNHEKAFIDDKKITDYLLSDTHMVGKVKARYFKSSGYNKANFEILANDLKSLASNDVADTDENQFGIKFIIDGEVKAPNGKIIKLRTIWFISKKEDNPRFITAYPL